MKKYITTFACLLLSLASLYAVWEGNGIAGVATDFKEDGMFVKSSLFPKYTLVEILNLENDIKVRSIVLEGSQAPGILMSFSPSVAEALKVSYGQVARIRVISPSVVSEADNLNVTDEKVTTSFEIENGPSIEDSTPVLVAEEKTLPTENKEDKNDDKLLNKDDAVLLYDFKPISKTIEKKGKDEGAISFDPAFIEEDISLNLNIPEKSLDDKPLKIEEKVENEEEVKIKEIKKIEPIEENPIEKKEKTTPIPSKEPSMAPKIEKKEESSVVVTPPKEVTTVLKHDIYLETTAPRPPKDVSTPKMKKKEEMSLIEDVISVDKIETKKEEKENIEYVKDVLTIEKKEDDKEVIKTTSEVPQIEAPKDKEEKADDEKVISNVIVLKEITKKDVEQDESSEKKANESVEDIKDVQDVDNAPPIKKKEGEDVKEDSVKVEEVMSPFLSMNELGDEQKIEDVKEIGEVENKENEKDTLTVEPVGIVREPKEKTSEKNQDVVDVPVVFSIEEKVADKSEEGLPVEEVKEIQEEPIDETPQEEEPIDETAEEEIKEEEPIDEPSEELEEMPQEDDAVEEPPLVNTPIEEMPTKEVTIKEPIIVGAIKERGLEEPVKTNAQELNERPLREIDVRNKPSKHVEIEEDRKLEEVATEEPTVHVKEKPLEEPMIADKATEEPMIEKKEESLEEPMIADKATEEPMIEKKEESLEEPMIADKATEEPMIEQKEEIKPKEQTLPKVEEKKEEIKKEVTLPDVETKKEEPVKKKEDNEKFSIGKILNGYTYVQIAVYNGATNVEEALRKYGDRYPLIVEKKGRNKYVVLVGPLQKHEAGAIKELFKSFGFSGCFVR